MYIRRTLYVHECLNANLHERNTTCVDKVSLKKNHEQTNADITLAHGSAAPE